MYLTSFVFMTETDQSECVSHNLFYEYLLNLLQKGSI